MSHMKRNTINKAWPIPRKGTKYLIVPSHNKKEGIPLLVIMRDVLKLVKTKKELKRIIIEKKVLVNNSPTRKENYSLLLFDTISLPLMKKYYRIIYTDAGKINVQEISEPESTKKIVKVMNKKILRKGLMQINMSDGRNFISKEKISVGDSIVINFKDGKLEKILPIKENSDVIVIRGKHRGKIGSVLGIEGNEIIVKSKDGDLKIHGEEVIVVK